jgi:hypothetical protein
VTSAGEEAAVLLRVLDLGDLSAGEADQLFVGVGVAA